MPSVKECFQEKIKTFAIKKILPYVFKVSKQPVLLAEMLQANKMHCEGMRVNESKLGFHLNAGKAHFVFFIICNLFIIPLVGIFHSLLTKVEAHLLILIVIASAWVVSAFFISYKEWLHRMMTSQQIENAWSLHLPHFSYKEHREEVAHIYAEAVKKEIPRKELELFVLNKLVPVSEEK